MEVSVIDPAQYQNQIRAMRVALLLEWGLPAQGKLSRPLSDGRYLGVFADQNRSQLIGVCEYLLYGALSGGYAATPYGESIDLAAICPPEQMVHVRSIYLDPAFRTAYGASSRMCAWAAVEGLGAGIRYATLVTLAKATGLIAFYRKIGGRVLGNLDLPGSPLHCTLMVIELKQLLDTPAIRRSLLWAPDLHQIAFPAATTAAMARRRLH